MADVQLLGEVTTDAAAIGAHLELGSCSSATTTNTSEAPGQRKWTCLLPTKHNNILQSCRALEVVAAVAAAAIDELLHRQAPGRAGERCGQAPGASGDRRPAAATRR